MKYKLLTILIFILSSNCFSQTETIMKQANELARAIESKNYAKSVDFTYAPFVSMMGGKEKMTSIIKKAMEENASEGTYITSVNIGQPQKVFNAGQESHCLVPVNVISKVPAGKKILNTYILAISDKKGENWTFLNLNEGMSMETISSILPNFNPEMSIPEIKPAEIIKD